MIAIFTGERFYEAELLYRPKYMISDIERSDQELWNATKLIALFISQFEKFASKNLEAVESERIFMRFLLQKSI